MKAARLRADLLARKGEAQPISGNEQPSARPSLQPREPLEVELPQTEPRRDKFGRVRVSLRLDPHRHLRLKLLSAHGRMSLQDTLIAALDAYLGDEGRSLNSGNCGCLQNGYRPTKGGDPESAG